jgi:hypothetical protein
MEAFKAIQSLGNVAYELAVELVFIPKTFFKVIRSPSWITDYINSQSLKDEKERYREYSYPMWFWLVIGVTSYFFLLEFLFKGFTDGEVLDAYNGISVASKLGGIMILFISLPISCALVIELFKNKKLKKNSFKKSFDIQCYCTAPLFLLYIPALIVDEDSIWLLIVGNCLTLGIIVWFIRTEFVTIKKEVQCGWFKALFLVGLMYLTYFIFAFITIAIFVLLNMDNLKKLVDAYFGE